MPLDVLGRTRATLTKTASLAGVWLVAVKSHWLNLACPGSEGLGNLVNLCRDGDRSL